MNEAFDSDELDEFAVVLGTQKKNEGGQSCNISQNTAECFIRDQSHMQVLESEFYTQEAGLYFDPKAEAEKDLQKKNVNQPFINALSHLNKHDDETLPQLDDANDHHILVPPVF